MKLKKLLFATSLLFSAGASLCLTSCEDDYSEEDNSPYEQDAYSCRIGGYVNSFDRYGSPHFSFSVEDLKRKSIAYGDLVDIQIGDDIFLKDVPFITGINEVGAFDVCLCDYNASGELFLGILSANFMNYIGGHVGDTIEISLSKKGGYQEMYKIMHSVYNTNRIEYGTDAQFANFREVCTTGIGKGVLYRSSNPLNPVDNAVRYAYADQLAKQAGIKTEIDLADTEEKINQYVTTEGFASTYCVDLYKNNNLIALGLDAAQFSKGFMEKLKSGLQFMVNNPAPYLVHCNEGKDRCGFVSLLLESLAGASYNEVTSDYMTTFYNFYHVNPNSSDYEVRKHLSVDRYIWMLGNYKNVDNINDVDWNNIDPFSVDLQKAAHDYIIDCGLTESECQSLISRLAGK